MKKAICLFFALALALSVSAAASAGTITSPYELTWSTTSPENAENTWASFTVQLPRGESLPTNISSYNPTSLTLTLDVTNPQNTWEAEVYGSNTIIQEASYTGNNQSGGTVTFDLTESDFNGTGYNWYSSSIEFSVEADCHVYGATYTVAAEPTSTPEPSTFLLLALGLAGLTAFSMKSRTPLATIS